MKHINGNGETSTDQSDLKGATRIPRLTFRSPYDEGVQADTWLISRCMCRFMITTGSNETALYDLSTMRDEAVANLSFALGARSYSPSLSLFLFSTFFRSAFSLARRCPRTRNIARSVGSITQTL